MTGPWRRDWRLWTSIAACVFVALLVAVLIVTWPSARRVVHKPAAKPSPAKTVRHEHQGGTTTAPSPQPQPSTFIVQRPAAKPSPRPTGHHPKPHPSHSPKPHPSPSPTCKVKVGPLCVQAVL